MSDVDPAIVTKLADIFADACAHGSTYESVVQTQFCQGMRAEFGDDEHLDTATTAAFLYAREVYGYVSAAEELEADAKNWEQGICGHGLTWQTCPAGCFEFG
ncbi:hypothetical protein [Pseudomonas sp. NPDC089569]|uniref:hypothetical protein n=1 Tax=Pseudomonas sp. NPDC089569 TaxID=3390722 RepID=UPI003D06358C